MLKYVAMETLHGLLPNGERYVSEAVLRDRLAPQVATGNDASYGMGLVLSTRHGIPVAGHTGSLIGYKSAMVWLPEHGVGAVMLTNADVGWVLTGTFRRKLLEVLFDGKPEADAEIAARSEAIHKQMAADRKLITIPADATEAAKLAAGYHDPALGDIDVVRAGPTLVFDFGEWRSPVASRKNPDGSISFVTTAPGVYGAYEFVVGSAGGKRTLVLRDAQHEYAFTER
jgi:hypothetical protein